MKVKRGMRVRNKCGRVETKVEIIYIKKGNAKVKKKNKKKEKKIETNLRFAAAQKSGFKN